MKIISFGWTAPAIVARQKRATRRSWKPRHAALFKKGDIIQAYDKAPFAGGKRICYIELTEDPVLEHMSKMPNSDYDEEGFAYLAKHPELIPDSMPINVTWNGFEAWRAEDKEMYVVRFRYREDLNE